MASTGSVDGWPLGPTELGEAWLRVLLRRRVRATQNLSHLARGMMCEYVSLVYCMPWLYQLHIPISSFLVKTAGAMRLPCAPKDSYKTHFLTDFYGENVFDLPMVPFVNSNENGFLKFYNMPKIQQKGKCSVSNIACILSYYIIICCKRASLLE